MKVDPGRHIVIAGAGAAGLAMAVELDRGLDSTWTITVIDPRLDEIPSKTWCFWGEPMARLEPFVSHSWRRARVAFPGWERSDLLRRNPYHLIDAAPYHRAHLRYLRGRGRVRLVEASVRGISAVAEHTSSQLATVFTSQERLEARWVFQSCFPSAQETRPQLLQHFGGWEIETQTELFDPESFTLMDFDLQQTGSATFRYLLPTSRRRALFEHTIFSSTRLARAEYDERVMEWISTVVPGSFRVLRREYGAIPMSAAPHSQQMSPQVFNLGGAGGMTKPTTGYTFARLQHQVSHLADTLIRTGVPEPLPDAPGRFAFYDGLLLEILRDSPELGRPIFEALFRRNSVDSVLTFLGEKSHLFSEARIFSGLPWGPFVGTLLRRHRPGLVLASDG